MSKVIDLVDDLKRAMEARDKGHSNLTILHSHTLKVMNLKEKIIKKILDEKLD